MFFSHILASFWVNLKLRLTGKCINLPIGEASHEKKVTRLKAYSASIEWYANILMGIKNAREINKKREKSFIARGKRILSLF